MTAAPQISNAINQYFPYDFFDFLTKGVIVAPQNSQKLLPSGISRPQFLHFIIIRYYQFYPYNLETKLVN